MKKLIALFLAIGVICIFFEIDETPEKKLELLVPTKKEKLIDTFYIHGLGDYDSKNLLKAKKILEENFNLICFIDDEKKLSQEEVDSKGNILRLKVEALNMEGKNVFVTNKLIVDKESKMLGIRRQNNLIVSDLNETETTLKHEYAHTLGMLHCPKKNCIMYEDETYAKDFCNTCKKNLKEINLVD